MANLNLNRTEFIKSAASSGDFIRDGLPKMRDVPAEMGGSGETLTE